MIRHSESLQRKATGKINIFRVQHLTEKNGISHGLAGMILRMGECWYLIWDQGLIISGERSSLLAPPSA